jgi:hypothetical protein
MKGATLLLILVGGALALVEAVVPRACGGGTCEVMVIPGVPAGESEAVKSVPAVGSR